MSAGNSQTWTEPPWSGWIETTGDALLILEAARRGLIPRVTRRLVDSERKMITSGSVFVFDEDESGIKRWTDGYFWSPSRILGNFLLYRETDKRSAGHRGARTSDHASPEADDNSAQSQSQVLSRPKTDSLGVDKQRERTLMGSLTNSYKFKPDGLMKKTFSLTIDGVAQHLISYYKIEDVENGRLRSPSSLPELASLDISPEYLDKTHFRNPPKVEVGPDGILRYRGEADDIETSSSLSGPLSSGLPLLTEGRAMVDGPKRAKRPAPYCAPPSKRQRKSSRPPSQPESAEEAESSTNYAEPSTSTAMASVAAAAAAPPPHFPAYPPYYPPLPAYPMSHPPPHMYPPNTQTQQRSTTSTAPPPPPAHYPPPWAYPQPLPASADGQAQHTHPAAMSPYYPYAPYPPHSHHPYAVNVPWAYPGYPPVPHQAQATQAPTNGDKNSTSAEEEEQTADGDS